jgi:hypothetical protein
VDKLRINPPNSIIGSNKIGNKLTAVEDLLISVPSKIPRFEPQKASNK